MPEKGGWLEPPYELWFIFQEKHNWNLGNLPWWTNPSIDGSRELALTEFVGYVTLKQNWNLIKDIVRAFSIGLNHSYS